jgi:hypothetical protein
VDAGRRYEGDRFGKIRVAAEARGVWGWQRSFFGSEQTLALWCSL